ncbi:MAG: CoA pyrophosphatase [Nevskiales bacterium]|nr:CoA pyrophosphatase [Nevskiales bacterium]
MKMTGLEQRLRRALAETSLDAPRPLCDLELPMGLDRLMPKTMFERLRPAAVLAPVIKREHSLSMLLTVRSHRLRSHRGQISFPGGGRDDGDAGSVDTALREAREEIGLDPGSVEVVGFLDDYPTLSRYLVTPVVGVVHGEPDLRLDDGEVAEAFEVPLDFLLDPDNFERKILGRDGLNVPFMELNWQAYRIWGATAGMLWDLARKVASLA